MAKVTEIQQVKDDATDKSKSLYKDFYSFYNSVILDIITVQYVTLI